jgi:hypothetical protein
MATSLDFLQVVLFSIRLNERHFGQHVVGSFFACKSSVGVSDKKKNYFKISYLLFC